MKATLDVPKTISAFELAVLSGYGRTGNLNVIADVHGTDRITIEGVLNDLGLEASGSRPDRDDAMNLHTAIQAGLKDGTIVEGPMPGHIQARPAVESMSSVTDPASTVVATPRTSPPVSGGRWPALPNPLDNPTPGSILAAIASLLTDAQQAQPGMQPIIDRLREDLDTLNDIAAIEAALRANSRLKDFETKATEVAQQLLGAADRISRYGTDAHVRSWAAQTDAGYPLDDSGVDEYIAAHPFLTE